MDNSILDSLATVIIAHGSYLKMSHKYPGTIILDIFNQLHNQNSIIYIIIPHDSINY